MLNYIYKSQHEINKRLYGSSYVTLPNLVYYGLLIPILEEFSFRHNLVPKDIIVCLLRHDVYEEEVGESALYTRIQQNSIPPCLVWLLLHVIGELVVHESFKIIYYRLFQRIVLCGLILVGNFLGSHIWPGMCIHIIWNCSVSCIKNYHVYKWNHMSRMEHDIAMFKKRIVVPNPFRRNTTFDDTRLVFATHKECNYKVSLINKNYGNESSRESKLVRHSFVKWVNHSITIN